VARQYNIGTSKGLTERKEIREGLSGKNGKLKKLLRGRFSGHPMMQRFNKLRNTTMHDVPQYSVKPNTMTDKDVRFTVVYNGEEEPLFEFLFGIYSHIVGNTATGLELLCPLSEKAQTEYDKRFNA
jgi:hypothetical protein